MARRSRARNEDDGGDIVEMCSFSGWQVKVEGNDRPAGGMRTTFENLESICEDSESNVTRVIEE